MLHDKELKIGKFSLKGLLGNERCLVVYMFQYTGKVKDHFDSIQ